MVLRGKLAAWNMLPRVLVMRSCDNEGCCPASARQVFLEAHPVTESVQLLDLSRPDAFTCLGDRSATCCGFDMQAKEEVVAVGVWTPALWAGHGSSRGVLLDPLLCALEAQGQDRVRPLRLDVQRDSGLLHGRLALSGQPGVLRHARREHTGQQHRVREHLHQLLRSDLRQQRVMRLRQGVQAAFGRAGVLRLSVTRG